MSTTLDDRELSVREAARSVHRAEETIRRWIWAGRLPARKVGGGYRIKARDVVVAAGGTWSAAEVTAPGPGLREWVEQVRAWRAVNGVSALGGAGQLVVQDRAERSHHGDR